MMVMMVMMQGMLFLLFDMTNYYVMTMQQ